MKNIDLTKDSFKIAAVSFSYNKPIQNELNNRMTIFQIQTVSKLWRMRRFSFEEKIIVFKSLAITKIVYLYLLTSDPNNNVEEPMKILKEFYGTSQLPKSSIQQLVWATEMVG